MQSQNESTTPVLPKAGFWPGSGVGLLDSGFLRIVFGLVSAGLMIAGVWALQQAEIIDATAYFTPTQLWIAIAVFIVVWTLSGFVTWGRERTYMKAGHPRYSAWVPIYNTMVMYTIVDMSPTWALLALMPSPASLRSSGRGRGLLYSASVAAETAETVATARANVEFARRFGKKPGFVGWFYLFGYGYIKLGFDDSVYNPNPDTTAGFEFMVDAKSYADPVPVAQAAPQPITAVESAAPTAAEYVPPTSVYVDSEHTEKPELEEPTYWQLAGRSFGFFVLLAYATPVAMSIIGGFVMSALLSAGIVVAMLAGQLVTVLAGITFVALTVYIVRFAFRMFYRSIVSRFATVSLQTALNYSFWLFATHIVALGVLFFTMGNAVETQGIADVREPLLLVIFGLVYPIIATLHFMHMYVYCSDLTHSTAQRNVRGGLFIGLYLVASAGLWLFL